MDHYGQVLALTGENKALVKIRAGLACGSCGRCGSFFGNAQKNQERLAEVFNPVGAEKGQLVRLEARSSEMLLAAFLLYLLPLIALLTGFFAGRAAALAMELTGSADMWGLGAGLLLMFLLFLFLRLQDQHFARSKRFRAVITAVVNEEDIPEYARFPETATHS